MLLRTFPCLLSVCGAGETFPGREPTQGPNRKLSRVLANNRTVSIPQTEGCRPCVSKIPLGKHSQQMVPLLCNPGLTSKVKRLDYCRHGSGFTSRNNVPNTAYSTHRWPPMIIFEKESAVHALYCTHFGRTVAADEEADGLHVDTYGTECGE